jgi:hypothetical protein
MALTDKQIFEEAQRRGIGHIPRPGVDAASLLTDVYPYNCRAKKNKFGLLMNFCQRYRVDIPDHNLCRVCHDRYGDAEDYLRKYIELTIENEEKDPRQKEINDLRSFVDDKVISVLESMKNKEQYQGMTMVQILASLLVKARM